ncbi:MAG: hypothetical protein AAF842_04465, partial [Planctomycetota bacterium]
MKRFRFTIGMKLGVAFGVVIAVMMAMSLVTYTRLNAMVAGQNHLIEVDFPNEALTLKVRGGVHEALSAHRGYIILGLEEL